MSIRTKNLLLEACSKRCGQLLRERDAARCALQEALYVISGYDDDEASEQFHETVERWRKAAGLDTANPSAWGRR